MYSLLSRFALLISLAVAAIPLTVDWEFFPLSIVIFLILKFGVLSSDSIERALAELSTSAPIPVDVSEKINPIEAQRPDTLSGENLQPITPVALSDIPATIVDIPAEIAPPPEPSRFSLWFHAFFADRPLAKVGGILLFLGALFFLYLVFEAVGPVGKILIGLAFGFSLIGVGVWLDRKSIETESRVLIGIGIAVNYLTILSGRHLLSVGLIASEPLFSDMFATFALLLNTALAIVLSLVYRSRVLLSFAFVFAYLTPFLVGSEKSSIFLLSVYIAFVTIAAAVIAVFYKKRTLEDASILHGIATFGMVFLSALAATGIATSGEYIALFTSLFISGAALLLAGLPDKRAVSSVFVGMYIVVLMSLFSDTLTLLPLFLVLLFAGAIGAFFTGILSALIVALLGIASFVFILIAFWIVGPTFFLSLLIVAFFVFMLLGSVLIRSASVLVGGVAIIGYGLLILLSLATVDIQDIMTSESVFLAKISSILLLVSASVFAVILRDARVYLLSIIVSGILLIFPDTFYGYFGISLIAAILYALISLIVPYILLVRGSLTAQSALLVGFPIASIVIAYSIYHLGQERFPGLMLGFAYILQAFITLVYALILHSYFMKRESTPTQLTKNTLLILFAVPLSLFTFALAFVFRDIPAVMSLAWVIESAVLYLIAVRMQDGRIFSAGHIVLFLGLIKETLLIDSFFSRDWLSLGLIAIMGIALAASLYVLRGETSRWRTPYDVLHILGIIILGIGISEIVPSTSTGWSILSTSIFIIVLTLLYRLFGSRIQHIFLTIMIGVVSVYFVGDFDYLKKDAILPLAVQWIALASLMTAGMIRSENIGFLRPIRLTIVILMGLIVSSLYVDYFFGTFTVSLYLALIASILIILGIQRDIPRYRTIGLYIGICVLLKILLYDIWYTSGDLIVRVIALMITGGLMIYLSQLYGKHVSRSWSEELDISNILPKKSPAVVEPQETGEDQNIPFDETLTRELENTDITDISGVRFVHRSGSDFTLRRVGIIKIARYIITRMGKTVFAPGELHSLFSGVLPHLQSTLSEKDLTSLLNKLQSWIDEGGEVELIHKK